MCGHYDFSDDVSMVEEGRVGIVSLLGYFRPSRLECGGQINVSSFTFD